MNRSLKMERVYNLQNYNTVRFSDEITDLPAEIDDTTLMKLRFLQMVSIEMAKNMYIKLQLNIMNREDEMEVLEKIRMDTLTDLQDLFAKKGE